MQTTSLALWLNFKQSFFFAIPWAMHELWSEPDAFERFAQVEKSYL